MQIDELPAGEQNQYPDMDMNRVVGTHDILMLCFDTLRYDVSKAEEAADGTPVLNSHGGLWEKRHAPGNFTYPSHFAIFAGFLPSANAMNWDVCFPVILRKATGCRLLAVRLPTVRRSRLILP